MLMPAASASPLPTVMQNGSVIAANGHTSAAGLSTVNINGTVDPSVSPPAQIIAQQQQQSTQLVTAQPAPGVSPTTATVTIPTAVSAGAVSLGSLLPAAAHQTVTGIPTMQSVAALQHSVAQAAGLPALQAAQAILPQGQKDTTWTKLFVGGLPYHTTDKSLREHFEVYGEIDEAVVITDRQTGKSRGYGFVIMANKEAAERACKEPNPIIDGRKANVNLAILGAKPRGNSLSGLPLAALQRFPTGLIPNQYGTTDFSSLAAAAQAAQAAQQLGVSVSLPSAATAAIAAQAAASSPVTAAALQAAAAAACANHSGGAGGHHMAGTSLTGAGGGKARSSMSLQLISGRVPTTVATPVSNPYLTSLYAATGYPSSAMNATAGGLFQMPQSSPASQGNPLAAMSHAAQSSGNPLLDAYNQYAALLAAQYNAQVPTTMASNFSGLEAVQQAGASSHYLPPGYAYSFPGHMGQLQNAALSQAGLQGYAAAAGPTTAVNQQPATAAAGAADGRIQ